MNEEPKEKKGNPNPSPETRFQPGQSGNPGGRPHVGLTQLVAKYLEWDAIAIAVEFKRHDLTAKEKIALRQVMAAMECGDKIESVATDRVFDRTEGKAIQRIALDGAEQLDETRKMISELLGYELPASDEGADNAASSSEAS